MISNLIPLWLKKHTLISVLWNLLGPSLCLVRCSVLMNVPFGLLKDVYCVCWVCCSIGRHQVHLCGPVFCVFTDLVEGVLLVQSVITKGIDPLLLVVCTFLLEILWGYITGASKFRVVVNPCGMCPLLLSHVHLHL